MTILSFALQVWPFPSIYQNKCFKFGNPCIKVEVMAKISMIYDHFRIWPLSATLTYSLPQGEHLCHIIMKSMHNCRGFGPDKLNLWPFQHLTSKCDLEKRAHNTPTTQAQGTHIHRTEIVTTMYLSQQVGLTKILPFKRYQTPRSFNPQHTGESPTNCVIQGLQLYGNIHVPNMLYIYAMDCNIQI